MMLTKLEVKEPHEILVAYLLLKVAQKDWHGVSDAANDIRVLEAQNEKTVTAGQ